MTTELQTTQKINLDDGLPKRKAKDIIQELKDVFSENEAKLTQDTVMRQKILNNFNLFDRDNNELINLSELKELLISINQMIPEDELEELYDELNKDTVDEGININGVNLLVFKKMRDEDKEEQLLRAFKMVVKDDLEDVESEAFKELLMNMGDKWSEDQADEFLKDADPKTEGKFNYKEFVRKLLKR